MLRQTSIVWSYGRSASALRSSSSSSSSSSSHAEFHSCWATKALREISCCFPVDLVEGQWDAWLERPPLSFAAVTTVFQAASTTRFTIAITRTRLFIHMRGFTWSWQRRRISEYRRCSGGSTVPPMPWTDSRNDWPTFHGSAGQSPTCGKRSTVSDCWPPTFSRTQRNFGGSSGTLGTSRWHCGTSPRHGPKRRPSSPRW